MISQDEIHILNLVSQKGRLYYYQGNFYYPLDLKGSSPGLIKRGIRDFMANNADLIARDRADPDYKTAVELFDDQCGGDL